jgi:hypothetical protein
MTMAKAKVKVVEVAPADKPAEVAQVTAPVDKPADTEIIDADDEDVADVQGNFPLIEQENGIYDGVRIISSPPVIKTQAELDLAVLVQARKIRTNPERFMAVTAIKGATVI